MLIPLSTDKKALDYPSFSEVTSLCTWYLSTSNKNGSVYATLKPWPLQNFHYFILDEILEGWSSRTQTLRQGYLNKKLCKYGYLYVYFYYRELSKSHICKIYVCILS